MREVEMLIQGVHKGEKYSIFDNSFQYLQDFWTVSPRVSWKESPKLGKYVLRNRKKCALYVNMNIKKHLNVYGVNVLTDFICKI